MHQIVFSIPIDHGVNIPDKKTDELIENDTDEDEEEEEYHEDEDRIKAETKVCGPDSKYIEDSKDEDREKSW